MEFVVIIEKAEDGSFSAYVPDLPGCVACADSDEEVRELIQEAVALHVESLKANGERVPSPTTAVGRVYA